MAHNGVRMLIALVAISGCLAAVAYAAARHGAPKGTGPTRQAPAARPPAPRITEHPEAQTTSSGARFGFAGRRPGARFQCRVDRGRWRACRSPLSLGGIGAGDHAFAVRARDRRGRRSAPAGFRWTVLEAKSLAIVPELSGLSALYPGAPPVALPLTVDNPNSVPILVTSLRVSAGGGPAGCSSDENLVLGPSNASDTTPLAIPAHGSVHLPSAGVLPPTIALRDLPLNQDACQGARFSLEFHGSAHG